jgi:hypothetical protein
VFNNILTCNRLWINHSYPRSLKRESYKLKKLAISLIFKENTYDFSLSLDAKNKRNWKNKKEFLFQEYFNIFIFVNKQILQKNV